MFLKTYTLFKIVYTININRYFKKVEKSKKLKIFCEDMNK